MDALFHWLEPLQDSLSADGKQRFRGDYYRSNLIRTAVSARKQRKGSP